MTLELTISKELNGYLMSHLNTDDHGELHFSRLLFEEGTASLEHLVRMLDEVLEFFGEGGSKDDPERIVVKIETKKFEG